LSAVHIGLIAGGGAVLLLLCVLMALCLAGVRLEM
jgi:hypothetical protein